MACFVSQVIPGWPTGPLRKPLLVGYFPGEGIGAEIVPPTLDLLAVICDRFNRRLELRQGGLIGKPAMAISGKALNDEAIDFCTQIFSDGGTVLCGPGGGRFVYELRTHFDLYCKLTPLVPYPSLNGSGCLRAKHLQNVDIIAVRENTGGLYFGESTATRDELGDSVVNHRFSYSENQVRRILAVAFAVAGRRRSKVCVTTKPGGMPAISKLWLDQAAALSAETRVEFLSLEIDNAVYQLIANPQAFDVVVSPNMFGDVLADAGALLLGSRGMSYSGNFGGGGKAVYQTGHGASYDLAGTDLANPLGQISSMAMMLRESLGLPEAWELVRRAVDTVLGRGFRTADIASPESIVVGTRKMFRLLLEAIDREDWDDCAKSPTTDRPAA